ncbi:aspartate aminotransferase family protein [Pelagibius litoralis]|uniref:Aspartate aminotransferase family protein n=1 Tax=Pelagibius litoralis TaxID=374515 RepID=A0A967K9W9_9PROT|nr:aspartate aminotransferase family protein [Pelagibius litoralis]NIA70152.1 aspartate aminotransferase family protein [Pelagibius litoralis]
MTVRSNSAASRDIAYHLHPYTNARKNEDEGPVIIDRGEGVYVIDDQGNRYLEALAGLWCTGLGFSEERLVKAAVDQMAKLPYYHSFAQKTASPVVDLAEKIVEMTPAQLTKVFFANSGSEANDTAIKMVWYYNNALDRPEKKKIISRIKGYHGVTIAAASLTAMPYVQAGFDLPIKNIIHTGAPHYYRFAQEGESEEAFTDRLAQELEELIQSEGPDTVAAFIGEPLQGAGGVIVPPESYWPKIQAVLKKYDILLIADEVICGFGRTGQMFGSDTFGLKPDIMTLAKQLSSAYAPISAVLVSDPIYQAVADNSAKLGSFGHGYTYGAHPVAAAVALETLKIYEERKIVEQVQAVGPRLQDGLRRFEDSPIVGEVRGIGLIAAVELVADKASKAPFDPIGKVGAYFAASAQAKGVIFRNLGDTIAACPPMIITEAEIDILLDGFAAALAETEAWVAEQGLAAVA